MSNIVNKEISGLKLRYTSNHNHSHNFLINNYIQFLHILRDSAFLGSCSASTINQSL